MKLNPRTAKVLRDALNRLNNKTNSMSIRGLIVEYNMKYTLRRKVELNCYIEPTYVKNIQNKSLARLLPTLRKLREDIILDVANHKFREDSRIIGLDNSIKLQNIFIKNLKLLKSVEM